MGNCKIKKQYHDGNYNAIDLVKFIMSICVVAIHTRPLINCKSDIIVQLYDCCVVLAVPFFFICAGFFLGRKLVADNAGKYNDLTPIYIYLKKVILLYVSGTVLYLPLTIIGFRIWNNSLLTSFIKFIRNFLIVGENYNSWSLWYLLSTIYALLFLLILLKKSVDIKDIVICGFIIIAVSIGIDYLVGFNGDLSWPLLVTKKVISSTIGGGWLFRGWFYIPLGVLLATKPALPFRSGVLLFLLGFALDYILVGVVSKFTVMLSAIGFFLIVVHIELPDSALYKKLRTISNDIYLLHLLIWSIYYKLVYGEPTFGFDCFIITSIISIVCSCVISHFRKRKMLH